MINSSGSKILMENQIVKHQTLLSFNLIEINKNETLSMHE